MDAARQMRSLFYYAPRKLVIHERQVPEFTGSASLQQNRLRGLASPGEHFAGGSRLWLLACGISPPGRLSGTGLGRIAEFRTFPWRERPDGL